MRRLAIAACALLAISAALAQANDPVAIGLEVFVITASGERIPATRAEPGDTIEYRLTARNDGGITLPAGLVVVTLPFPDGVSYLPDTATDGLGIAQVYVDASGTFTFSPTRTTDRIRWTYTSELEPGEWFQVAARFRMDGEPRSAPLASPPTTASSLDRDADAFAQAMFGHLSVIQIPCPGGLSTLSVCGETRRDFDSFMQTWDLHADWESRLPVLPPTPTTAWRRDGDSYYRGYTLSGRPITVFFDEGFVIIGW